MSIEKYKELGQMLPQILNQKKLNDHRIQ